MNRVLLLLSLWLAISILPIAASQGQAIGMEPMIAEANTASLNSLIAPASVDLSDTLLAKRRFWVTDIYKKGEKLTKADMLNLYQDSRKAQKMFRAGNTLKPIAALVSLSGLLVGYLGIKGTVQTAMIKGVRTPTNASVPDVPVEYINRSLPKVLGGLGLFLGGLSLLEVSHELTTKSVVLYNTKSVSQKSISQVRTIKIGLTSGGSLGVEARF